MNFWVYALIPWFIFSVGIEYGVYYHLTHLENKTFEFWLPPMIMVSLLIFYPLCGWFGSFMTYRRRKQ